MIATVRIGASLIRATWLALGGGWLALVAYLSLVPRPPGAELIPTDVGHFVAYAWMTGWFGQLAGARRTRLVAIAGALALYGALLEALQSLTQVRHPSLADVAINTAGVIAGLALMRTRLAGALDAMVGLLGASDPPAGPTRARTR